MGSGAARAKTIITFVAAIGQSAAAIAIVYLVANRLQTVEVDDDNRGISEVQCALDKRARTDSDEDSLCKLAFVGSAITFAALVVMSLLLCLTCNCFNGPLGDVIAFLVYTVLCVGWVLYASWVTDSARAIDGWDSQPVWDTDEVQNARSAVVALSWVEALMLAILATVTLLTGCCCPANENRK